MSLVRTRAARDRASMLILAGLLAAPFSLTQQGDELEHLVSLLDSNGDGALGEYEAMEGWSRLVRDAAPRPGGTLTARDLRAFLLRSAAEEQEERRELFAEMDEDRDGFLTDEEVTEEFAAWMASLDEDGDQRWSRKEILEAEDLGDPADMLRAELLDMHRDLDTDGDGRFGLQDLPEGERAEFHGLDQDGDGQISRHELLVLVQQELEGALFEVEEDVAHMHGVIGSSTPGRILELVLEHPRVRTIVMHDIPGSLDDEACLRAASMVRRHGFATHVPADGRVASGGTDFFLAGVQRGADEGARFGVHSWADMDREGSQVPRDDPEHRLYLEYYREMGIPADFYWYTLQAASAEDIHWMRREELERYSILTEDSWSSQVWEDHVPDGVEPYGLKEISVPEQGSGVVALPETVDGVLRRYFDRYARVVAPNGKPIHILADKSWSEDQIVHVRKVLEHFLAPAPGSRFGADKSAVANAMADRRATMVLFEDEPTMERALQGPLGELELGMQDLRANECTPPGSPDYLAHRTRDATFEEVLHLVHNYGIYPALPEYDALIRAANLSLAEAGKWQPWPADEPDSHRYEYIAAVYDNYLDLWSPPPTHYEGMPLTAEDLPQGTSHFGAFFAGSRVALARQDPRGLELVEMYFPPFLTYTAELPSDFDGTFDLNHDSGERYAAKAKYLDHVGLRGTQEAKLVGNLRDNELTGNAGDNELQGNGGNDLLVGGPGDDLAIYRGERTSYDVEAQGDWLVVRDRVSERDGTDRLQSVERLRFADGEVKSPE